MTTHGVYLNNFFTRGGGLVLEAHQIAWKSGTHGRDGDDDWWFRGRCEDDVPALSTVYSYGLCWAALFSTMRLEVWYFLCQMIQQFL